MGKSFIPGIAAAFLVVLSIITNAEVRSCSAQDFTVWQPRSLIVRGQEPEAEPPEAELDHIETDRDSFTPATTTAGQGRSILEAAYSLIDNRGAYDTHSFPESLLRYGLNDRIELLLGWNYEVGGTSNTVSGSDVGDFELGARIERASEISYGAKIGITEQDAWRPRSAFVGQAFTPTTGPATSTDFVGTYVFGWELPDEWQFDAALRYGFTSEEHDHFNQWAPSVVLKLPVADRWFAHVEYFSINTSGLERDRSVHFFSPGAHYLVTPNFEVGARFGWGLTHDSANVFSNIGVGLRF